MAAFPGKKKGDRREEAQGGGGGTELIQARRRRSYGSPTQDSRAEKKIHGGADGGGSMRLGFWPGKLREIEVAIRAGGGRREGKMASTAQPGVGARRRRESMSERAGGRESEGRLW
ncbi:hypothetical protein E2562_031908 [Oryza meyeriana var. granulata]|uniref:DUF834 domain-containing protein n=1 Tax=Oryza meyeriana var. granulata TaxID=110450 RepID=A0A6G1BPB7_9ORYZ|nr:hypothetical protein E2562_031908 [Oryza meyeriana var. granulata]